MKLEVILLKIVSEIFMLHPCSLVHCLYYLDSVALCYLLGSVVFLRLVADHSLPVRHC